MRDALVFSGACQLDFQEVRANVIRIPEVVKRIREAQSIWDSVSPQSLDLTNFIASDDSIFLGQIRLKSFATAVVQIGLLDRYLRQNQLPEFLVGVINGDSPLKVAIGATSFVDLIAESPAVGGNPEPSLRMVPRTDLPILTGVQIAEYAAFRRSATGEYERLSTDSREIEQMLLEMVERFELTKLVTVGPGHTRLGRRIGDLTSRDVHVLDSIELDPLLTWFWAGQKETRLAVAN